MTSINVDATTLLNSSFKALSDVEYGKMFEIARKCTESPDLIKRFSANPVLIAQEIAGFSAPNGFHMHIVDSNNNYHPPEADALSQIKNESGGGKNWTRIEVRAGYDEIACIICLWCKSGPT